MAFTNEQNKAIKEVGKNITVAASAGSGKTTVLVARIMKRVIEDRVPLDHFLAMTFTEAAANEMKSRLFDELTKMMLQEPSLSEYCKEQLVLLSKAQISTIHSFCLSVIKENYAYIGFDLQRVNTIISQEEEEIYFQKSFQDTVKQYEGLSSFNELKQYFTTKVYDNQDLCKEIRSLSSKLKELNYDEYYAMHKQLYTASTISDFPVNIKYAIFSYLQDYLYYLEESLNTLLLLCENNEKLLIKKEYLSKLKECCINQDYSSFRLYLHGFVQIVYPPLTNHDVFKKVQGELRKIEDSLLEILFDEDVMIHDLHAQWPLIDLFLQMGQFYNQRMEYYKKENQFMDFDDMEFYAYQILSQYPEVADIYRNRFTDILVDEYQDSSKHQDHILSFITNGNNIFRVGDVKQSIYRFRNATPDLLKGYIEHPSLEDQVIFLRHNFRSNSQIIHFVNHVFQDFMNLSTLQSNFAEEDLALVGSAEQEEQNCCIEYHVIKKDDIKDNDETEDYSTTQIRAEYIASEIARIKGEDNCKWSDFVVLVRSNERKIDLKRAFTKLGIPNFIDSKEGFYKSSAVTYITSFIQCVISPYVDNYFVALALSPFYEITDNEIAEITLRMRELGSGSYYEYAKLNENEILSNMVKDLTNLRSLGSLRDTLIYMYNVNQYYNTYTTHNDRTNLDSLLEKACNYENTHSDGLEGFCSYITSLKEFKSAEALSINSKEDVVRVMTIHQSKGLQFSYVFYWGKEKANHSFNDTILKDDQLGICMDYMNVENRLIRPSLLSNIVVHKMTKADVEEEIRVIYVALTRPKKKLFLTTVLSNSEFDSLSNKGISSYELLRSQNYSKWLLKKCMEITNGVTIKEVSALSLHELPDISSKTCYQINQLPNYPHESVKSKPSFHGISLSSLQKNEAMQLGTMLHRMLEIIDFSTTYSIEQLQQIAKQEFTDSQLVQRLNYSSILIFLENSITKSFIDFKIYKEYPVLYQDKEAIVSGIIDLLIEAESSIYIVDYKTDILDASKLISLYSSQLKQYQSIIQKVYPNKTIELYIYSLHLNEYIQL